MAEYVIRKNMQKILGKRIGRNLKENKYRYIALCFLIILGMYMVIRITGAADTIIRGVDEKSEKNQVEDGSFSVYEKLSEDEKEYLESLGIRLEEKFSLDYLLSDNSVVRVYKIREYINLIELDQGKIPENANELVIEKRFAAEHGYQVGTLVSFGNNTYIVSGIGSVPDYDAPYKNGSDTTIDSRQFGLVFLCEEAYEKLAGEKNSLKSEEYEYAYQFSDHQGDNQNKIHQFNTIKEKNQVLKAEIKGIVGYNSVTHNILTNFVTQEDNIRIKASANDQIVKRNTGILAGIIAMMLFTYVISVFVIHEIERENTVIGALYALGVKRKELIRHYMVLPVLVTFLGGTAGTLLGYSSLGARQQMKESYAYFSFPKLETYVSPYLLIYGMIMPPVVAYIVNYLVIRKKLERPALALIRNDRKINRVRGIKLQNLGFVGRFRIRQMLREIKSVFIIFLGMLLSLAILMIGLNTYTLCKNVSRNYKKDPKFEYMYTYKYPDDEVTEGGEACYAKTFRKENLGYQFDVIMLGIDQDNPYFKIDGISNNSNQKSSNTDSINNQMIPITDNEKINQKIENVFISSAMAQKYRLHAGEKFSVTDKEEDVSYEFIVSGIVKYSVGFYLFVNINDMRTMFNKPDRYYNVVLSEHALKIDSEKLYSMTTKEEIVRSSDVMLDLMKSLIDMVIIVSAIVFAVVMYLMMSVTIDRSLIPISLLQVFGFRKSEIQKLYLNGNFYIVMFGALVGVPIAKKLMDAIFPYMVANIGCAVDVAFDWWLYVIIFVMVIVLYFIINVVLVEKIRKITLEEVLKNRD